MSPSCNGKKARLDGQANMQQKLNAIHHRYFRPKKSYFKQDKAQIVTYMLFSILDPIEFCNNTAWLQIYHKHDKLNCLHSRYEAYRFVNQKCNRNCNIRKSAKKLIHTGFTSYELSQCGKYTS